MHVRTYVRTYLPYTIIPATLDQTMRLHVRVAAAEAVACGNFYSFVAAAAAAAAFVQRLGNTAIAELHRPNANRS